MRCITGVIVQAHGPSASCRAPRRRTGLSYPIGHARGGKGSRPWPPTNQIEGKKLPAFKILLLRHHLPPCGEQVVLEARAARTARRVDGQVGWASGPLEWRRRPPPDLTRTLNQYPPRGTDVRAPVSPRGGAACLR